MERPQDIGSTWRPLAEAVLMYTYPKETAHNRQEVAGATISR